MDELELAWVAGLLEGEGCFTVGLIKQRPIGAIQCNMTDRDVIYKLQKITGVGTICTSRQEGLGWKPIWRWHVTKIVDVKWLCQKLIPWLGIRRKIAASKLLDVVSFNKQLIIDDRDLNTYFPPTNAELKTTWIAGLLEGEGSFIVSGKRSTDGSNYPVVSLACGMTDEDVIERLLNWTNVGAYVKVKPPINPKHKQVYSWRTSRQADIFKLCHSILPFMMERRTKQIDKVLDVILFAGYKRQRRHGTRNSYETGCRCRPCKDVHSARFRARRLKKKQQELKTIEMVLND